MKYVIIEAGKDLDLSFQVTNIGWYAGDEVAQAYITWESLNMTMPNIQLVDFQRIERINKGETRKVVMKIPHRLMAGWRENSFVIEEGN